MAIDIPTFKATVQDGFQKPDKYRIMLPLPSFFFGNPFSQQLYETARTLEFYSDSVDFIGINMQTVPIHRYGYGAAHEYVYGPTFQNAMITFYNDQDGDNLFYFQQWISLCNNFDMTAGIEGTNMNGTNTYESRYRDDYVVDGTITLLNQQGNGVCTWTMRNMYPKAIPESKLAWAITGDIHRITVIFSYVDWAITPQPDDLLMQNIPVDTSVPAGIPGAVG